MTGTTEQANPRSKGVDARTVLEILEIINAEDAMIAPAINAVLPRVSEAVTLLAESLRKGGRVFFVGAGTSGRLGVLEAAEIPPTYGLPPETFVGVLAGGPGAMFRSAEQAEDMEELAASQLESAGLTGGDVLVLVSASGRTPFVLGAARHGRRLGAGTVGVSCNRGAALSGLVDVPVEVVVGPEVVAGSTRMKAGTAQKMVLNMITTAAMIRLGLVHDGYMVGVQASNRKLVERSTRMVSEITGLPQIDAQRLLKDAGGDVRVAVVMALTGASAGEAAESLKGWRSIRDVVRMHDDS